MTLSPCEATLLPILFRVFCGDGEGENDKGGDGADGAKTGEAVKDGKDGKSGDGDTPDLEKQLDEERSARIQLQRERDEAAEAAQQTVRESQEEGDRVAAERDDYKAKYEKLKTLMETSYLDNAILQQDKFNFHDAAAVRTFLDPKQIRLNMDTGEVEGLQEQLRKIAREKPYLVKQADDEGGEGGKGVGGGNFQPPAGASGGRSSTQPPRGQLDKAKLAAKYKMPGLAGISGGRT